MNILTVFNISTIDIILIILLIILFIVTAIAIHVIRRNQPKKEYSILDDSEDDLTE